VAQGEGRTAFEIERMVTLSTSRCHTACQVYLLKDNGDRMESASVPAGTRGRYVGHFGPQKGMVRLKTDAGLLIEVNTRTFREKWDDVS
jgi:hypothetical protein